MKLYVAIILVMVSTAVGEPFMQEESSTQKANSIFIIRPFNNPVTTQEIEQLKTTIFTNFEVNFEKPSHPLVLCTFDVPEGAVITAYGFKLWTNGLTMQYVGMAGDPQSVSIIHEKAQLWNQKTEKYQREGVWILGATWIMIGLGEGDYYSSPYGGVTNNWEIRWLSSDGSSTRDWFAVKQIFAMEPGYQRYDSSWKNYRGYPTHNWSVSTLSNPQLHDWDPLGTQSGSTTISVSVSGGSSGASASWGWSYTQPAVTTVDQSSTGSEKAKWEMKFNNGDVQKSTGGMKPGSSCGVDQPSSGTYKLIDLKSKGKFRKSVWWWYDYVSLTHTWHLYVTY
jgi:hypothetical protein